MLPSLFSTTLVVALSFAVGCGAKQKKDEEVKLHTPPEDSAVALPEGPPILLEKSRLENKNVENVSKEKAHGISLSRADLDEFVALGPPFALSVVTVEPSKRNGKMFGYKIVDLTKDAETQLKPHLVRGDVITHINGLKLLTPDDYFAAWKTLASTSTVRIDFVRDTKPTHVIWNVK